MDASLVIAIIATITSAIAAGIAFYAYRAQTDPNVIVYLEHDEKRPTLILLVIENIGLGVAHNVSFSIPPNFPRDPIGLVAGENKKQTPMTTGPLISGIKTLPPKGRRILSWGQYGGIFDYMGAGSVTVGVKFTRKGLFEFHEQPFETECELDILSFSSTDASRRSEAAHLQTIAGALESIQTQFGTLNNKIEMIGNSLTEQRSRASRIAQDASNGANCVSVGVPQNAPQTPPAGTSPR